MFPLATITYSSGGRPCGRRASIASRARRAASMRARPASACGRNAARRAATGVRSQFVNEAFGRRAGLPDAQMGLGDAYEIDPDLEDGFLFQVAQAQLARQIFPHAPLKYMPPTKHMTGNIFKGHLIDAMFNLTSVMTHQSIHLCGMLTV